LFSLSFLLHLFCLRFLLLLLFPSPPNPRMLLNLPLYSRLR
jgi:hypothetical protein